LEQEDFLKRQIDQLGRVLGKILADLSGLKVRGHMNEGIEAASQVLKTELGFNTGDLALIPADGFLQTLLETGKFSDSNFEQLAELMFLIAEELHSRNTDVGKMNNLYERSLIIYEILDQVSPTYSIERHNKIGKIKQMLK